MTEQMNEYSINEYKPINKRSIWKALGNDIHNTLCIVLYKPRSLRQLLDLHILKKEQYAIVLFNKIFKFSSILQFYFKFIVKFNDNIFLISLYIAAFMK